MSLTANRARSMSPKTNTLMPIKQPDAYHTNAMGSDCFFILDGKKMNLSEAISYLIYSVGFSREDGRAYLRSLMPYRANNLRQ